MRRWKKYLSQRAFRQKGIANKHRGRIPATPILLTNQLTNNNLIYDEKTTCVLMVQRYKQYPSPQNLFSEPPFFFNKTLPPMGMIYRGTM